MATTTRQKKELVRRSFDAWNEADVETFDELVAADAEYHDPMTPPDLPSGPGGEKRLLELYQSAFPDATLEIEDMIAEGDEVAVRWTATGTHEGELMGVEPTGNEVEIVGFEIRRIEDGQIVESWALFDGLGLMEQLDAVPERSAD